MGGLICLQPIINIHLFLVVLLLALSEFKTLKYGPWKLPSHPHDTSGIPAVLTPLSHSL